MVYDEKGLEDGYHRLIAAKILKKPRFSYRLVENLQESIRRILREETELPSYIRRRVTMEELDELVDDVKNSMDNGRSRPNTIYGLIQDFIMSKESFKLTGETEEEYWYSYEKFANPLVDYVKSKLD